LTLPRLVVAGVASGVGKTTTTIALARAMAARGMRVALFKCGPDYLDPTYHARASGRPSHNLDGWLMGRGALLSTFARGAQDADIAIIEGVMGLFDGASPTAEQGSTAEVAKWLGAPVVAVVDASGMARTIAAVGHGLATFDPELRLAGLICNRVGSKGHIELLRSAVRCPPVLGGFPKDPELAFPERHLGLRTASEDTLPSKVLERWGAMASEWLAMDALLDIARSAGALPESPAEPAVVNAIERRCRIAVAHDDAFHFYYDDNLWRLEQLGATLIRFSPMRDLVLPDVDGVYLGGGYPELHADALTRNVGMRESLRAFAEKGGPIYAECGGLMYLARAIRTLDDTVHPMVGLFDGEAVMKPKLQALGYVEVETQCPTLLGAAGLRFRGHQFRYSELVGGHEPAAYSVRTRRSGNALREGWTTHNVVASYVHAHWASNELPARGFVDSCASFGRDGTSAAPPRRGQDQGRGGR